MAVGPHPGDDEPNYCPGCSVDWRMTNLDDVNWPLTITAESRVDLHYLMKMETGIESSDALWSFSDDVEDLIALKFNRVGTFVEVSVR